jgi:hypothetical protein
MRDWIRRYFLPRAPGTFLLSIWNNLKKYATVYRALEGINAVVVGIKDQEFYMMKDYTYTTPLNLWENIGVGVLTFFFCSTVNFLHR